MNISNLVDLAKYPVENIQSGIGLDFADECRQKYEQTGLCMLSNFVNEDALKTLADESSAYLEHAYFCDSTHNPYLDEKGHEGNDSVSRHQEKTYVGSVPYDKIPRSSILNKLYQWDPLKNFIGHVLGKKSFYRFADPFGACSVNVFVDGGIHGWHFDESEFTVTLMLQAPENGGEFEYVPLIRGLDNEKEIINRVLDGDRSEVVKLPFMPATLLIFGGRQTLHRVSRISGERPRLVPVLCFSEKPKMQNSESVRKLFWGRAGPDTNSSHEKVA